MADTRNITITILKKSDIGETHSNDKGGQTVDPNKKAKNEDEKEKKANKFAKGVATMIALSGAKHIIESTIQLSLNRYFSMSEDYIAQNDYKNIMTGIGKVFSAGSSVVAGVTSGLAFGGAVGGVIGGVVAGAGWVGQEVVNMQQTKANYYSQINASNINTAYMRERAGLYLNGKGTEN